MPRRKPVQYKLRSVLVCDDVRREESGKQILIGVYNRNIIFPGFPAALMQLFVHIAVEMKTSSANEVHFKIVDDTGLVRADLKRPFPGIDARIDNVFNFRLVGLAFEKETRTDILFGVDREPETVATLEIRLPESDEERAKISTRS